MVMFFVISAEKALAEGSGILNGAEPFRELRTTLQRFELGFRVRVVVTDVRAAVGFGYSQVTEKMRHCL